MADNDNVFINNQRLRRGLVRNNHDRNQEGHEQIENHNNKQGAGILLRTLRKGDNDGRSPQQGDSCLIHYDGFLEDGHTKIVGCSSRDISQPLRFDVWAQQVIEGMDVAVQQMTVGQVAEITIPHCYAYGAPGYPPHIPPKATLVFHLELLEVQAHTGSFATNSKRAPTQQQQQQQHPPQHRRWFFFLMG